DLEGRVPAPVGHGEALEGEERDPTRLERHVDGPVVDAPVAQKPAHALLRATHPTISSPLGWSVSHAGPITGDEIRGGVPATSHSSAGRSPCQRTASDTSPYRVGASW